MAGQKLGQHFLTRPEIAGWVADAVPITKQDTVLEIGPGEGILTHELLQRAGKVVAIEKDSLLVSRIRDRFKNEISNGHLILIEKDIRDFVPSDCPHISNDYSLVANIPYYITGTIIRQFLSTNHQPKNIVVLVQKEVAQRIVAKGGKESLLSLSVKAYGTPRYVKTVKAGSFSPPPKVDSAILAIEDISRKNFKNTAQEQRFFDLLHRGFSSKRKVLIKNLGIECSQEQFASCKIHLHARAENLSISDWFCLLG